MKNIFKEKRLYTIYGLKNPGNRRTFYIGSTSLPIKERLWLHLNQAKHNKLQPKLQAYINQLSDRCLKPDIYLIESGLGYLEKKEAENRYIDLYSKKYTSFCNVRVAYKPKKQPKNPHRDRRKTKYSLAERELIDSIYGMKDPMKISEGKDFTMEHIRVGIKAESPAVWVKKEIIAYYLKKAERIKTLINIIENESSYSQTIR